MNIWNPLARERWNAGKNRQMRWKKNAVAIIRSDSWEKETIAWHIPQNISKAYSMFLKVPNTSIEFQVIGKRLNRGGGATVLKFQLSITFMAKKNLQLGWIKRLKL